VTTLEGTICLVTGASRGIGRAIANGLAEAGADIVGAARSESDLEELRGGIEQLGRDFLPLMVDLSLVEELEPAADAAWKWRGRIDVLVNGAGVVVRNDVPETTSDDWDYTFAVNVRGPFLLTQAIGRRMLEGEGGSVLNIASLAGEKVTGAPVSYCASKAALIQMTRALAVRWAPRVRVNSIAPGYVRTSLNAEWLGDPENLGYVVERTPMGRVGEPIDVVGAAVFLASPAAAYITGANLLVDGGWSAQ
jgi:NAD(P)-dependent dehydrogenase (short-subunit alcohol dehydrogenase family)